ncbi:class I SAM-dependent methyltransferase [Rhizobium sp. Leaf371]|uniref:class I SAM-dependent methyltransferase n=1 Tax=Rhizobium sp. Leaf371 TaxID=1736355 RepID=UPI0009E69973|nr:class I SAM-dependent methyltransferase [Rhizobium sp. Leaf371]
MKNRKAELAALMASETRNAFLLSKFGFKVESAATYVDARTVVRPRTNALLTSDYYQGLHQGDEAYQENNWLVSELTPILQRAQGGTVVEIGCGNGQFSKLMAGSVQKVHAFDWALSPGMISTPDNVRFHQGNILQLKLPPVDLACSADVLEHFTPQDLPGLIAKICSSAMAQYHVVACYDDGHSHLTVMSPAGWLATFWRFCPDATLLNIDCRRSNPQQLVCTIATTLSNRRHQNTGGSSLAILHEILSKREKPHQQ